MLIKSLPSFGYFKKSRNDDSFYFVLIYRGYHKNDLLAITSRLRGHLPILGYKIQMSI